VVYYPPVLVSTGVLG